MFAHGRGRAPGGRKQGANLALITAGWVPEMEPVLSTCPASPGGRSLETGPGLPTDPGGGGQCPPPAQSPWGWANGTQPVPPAGEGGSC